MFPRATSSSFVARVQIDLKGRERELADACWTFHERVINQLDINVVLCFGQTSGEYVRRKLGANELVETFVEKNARGWKSQSFRNTSGTGVVVATHPSIAAWNTTAATLRDDAVEPAANRLCST